MFALQRPLLSSSCDPVIAISFRLMNQNLTRLLDGCTIRIVLVMMIHSTDVDAV
jgi:hypothetical protein